jgi:hypothetical protein
MLLSMQPQPGSDPDPAQGTILNHVLPVLGHRRVVHMEVQSKRDLRGPPLQLLPPTSQMGTLRLLEGSDGPMSCSRWPWPRVTPANLPVLKMHDLQQSSASHN